MKKKITKTNGKAPPLPELFIIRWRDTIHSVGWEKITDPETNCPAYSSVGWIAYRDDETLKLATTIADDNSGAGILSIPLGCIVSEQKIVTKKSS